MGFSAILIMLSAIPIALIYIHTIVKICYITTSLKTLTRDSDQTMTSTKSVKTSNKASPQTNTIQQCGGKNRSQHNRAQSSRSHAAASGSSLSLLLLLVIFLAGLIGAAQQHMLPISIVGIYLILSLLTFIAYAIDKSAAKGGRWRTKESTLHLLALMGGWPGALFAQHLLKHKSVKTSFRIVFWFTVITNLAVLGYGIKTGAMDLFI